MILKNKKVVIFDLDDTLYYEINFLKSAYLEISDFIANSINTDKTIVFNDMLMFYQSKENCFEKIIEKYDLPIAISDLLHLYRNHKPNLILSSDRLQVLNYLKQANIPMGILTDGRSVQQRNKIKALGIENYFDKIVVSEEIGTEKPHINNFKTFETTFGNGQYYYIGDNIKKDFITPNKLKWTTICLKDIGLNVHNQNAKLLTDNMYMAKYTVDEFPEIIDLIK